MLINCHLKGSTFCDGQTILKDIVSNDRTIQPEDIYLVRDYNCEKDPNCVQVRYRNGGTNVKIGNVNIENATLIASCMDEGRTVEVKSLQLCGSVDTNIGIYFIVDTMNLKA